MAVKIGYLSAFWGKKWQLLMAVILLSQLSFAQCITSFPYKNDFESNTTGWTTGGTASDWTWGTPAKSVINQAASGTKCWVTGGLTGSSYNNGELAWLQSPCFNFSGIPHPYVAFMVFWETERNYDGTVLEYTTNNGATWQRAGSVNDPTNCLNGNWFNTASVRYANNGNGWSGSIQGGGSGCGSGGGSGKWVLANHTFPALAGQTNVRFRFLFGAGTSCNAYNGFAVDDFYVAEAPPNQALFSFSCVNGNTVVMNNVSIGCPSYSWNFGDPASGSSNSSTAVNPTHSYSAPGTYTISLTASGPDNAPSTITKTVTILDLNTQIVLQPKCNGDKTGSAVVTASPNVAGLTYNWNSSPAQNSATANNLGAGTYIVTVSGTNVCSTQDNITITEPQKISNTVTLTQPGCQNNDGVISIATTGGAAPYTYTWTPNVSTSNTASGLATGNYSIVVKDANNCTVLEQATLNSGTALTANVLNKQDVTCTGNNNGSITVGVNGGSPPYDFSWAPYGGNQQTAGFLGPGTYTLTIKDQKGCTLTASATITEPAQMAASITKTDAVCNIDNGTATAVVTGGVLPYSYSWAPGGYTTNNISNLAANTYYFTATDNNGCKVSRSVTIVNAANGINLQTQQTNVLCHGGNTGTATVVASGGTAPYTYQWSNGGSNSSISNLTSGTYSITVKDATGCSSTTSVTITEPAAMSVALQTTNAVCNKGNGSLQATVTGGLSPYTYSWNTGSSTTNMLSAIAGAYTISVTDNNGCKISNSATITEPNAISFDIATANVTCASKNGSAFFTSNPAGGTGALTTTWNPGNKTGNRVDNLDLGNYTVTVSDAAGCQVTKAFEIITTHEGALGLTLNNTNVTCFGTSTGTATAIAFGGNDTILGNLGYTYTWSNGQTGSTISNLPAGLYTVVAKSNSSGCLHTGFVPVSEAPAMTISTTTVNPLCAAGNGSIASSVTGGSGTKTYLWTPGNMTTPDINNIKAGTYQLTVTDRNGCKQNKQVVLSEPAILASSIQVEQPNCTVNVGMATATVTGGTAPYSYKWSPGNSTTNSISNLAAGTYTVAITDKNGCKTQNTATINSFNSIVAQTSKTDVLCNGQGTGTAAVVVSGGQSPYNILWSNGVAGSTINNLVAGNYTVTIKDAGSCIITKTVNITQPEKINIQLTSLPAICTSATGSITSNVAGGNAAYQYRWQPGNNTNAQLQNAVAGNYTLTVTDANGCTANASTRITSNNPLSISLGKDTSICANANEKVLLNPGSFNAYVWQDGSRNSSITAAKEGLYYVTVTNVQGCIASDSINIKNECGDIYFPTAFTPNADGKNDLFGPLGNLSALTNFELVVYNRWGQRVFSSNNPFIKWDGRMAGAGMITGTYVWHARYSSRFAENQVQNGTVILIR